jgi:hypothetical protein
MSDMSLELRSDMTHLEMVSLRAHETGDEPSPKDEIRLFVREGGAPLPTCDPLGSPINFSMSMGEGTYLQDGFRARPTPW